MDQLPQPTHAGFDFAVNRQTLSGNQSIHEVRRSAIPQQTHGTGGVCQLADEYLATAARIVLLLNARKRANEGFLLADNRLIDLFDLPPILVAKRQMIQKILDGSQPESGQLLGARRTDTFEKSQGCLQRATGYLRR